MATKKEMVSEILSIENIDTESNLMAKTSKELQSILEGLTKSQEPSNVVVNVSANDIDLDAIRKQLKEELMKELAQEAKSQDVAQTPKRKTDIDRFEQIPVMNCTNGQVVFISKKTGAEYLWTNYGDVEYLEMQELISMRSGSRDFLHFPYLIVLDDNAVEYLGLTKMYKNLIDLENIENIFNLNLEEFKEIVEKAPKGLVHTIVSKAKLMHEQGTLDSVAKVKFLNQKFGTDIGQRG